MKNGICVCTSVNKSSRNNAHVSPTNEFLERSLLQNNSLYDPNLFRNETFSFKQFPSKRNFKWEYIRKCLYDNRIITKTFCPFHIYQWQYFHSHKFSIIKIILGLFFINAVTNTLLISLIDSTDEFLLGFILRQKASI